QFGEAWAANALDSRLDRPRVRGARDAGAVEHGDVADQAVAGNEDRTAVPVPDEFAGRVPVRSGATRVAVPGPAGAHAVAVVPELSSHKGVRRTRFVT